MAGAGCAIPTYDNMEMGDVGMAKHFYKKLAEHSITLCLQSIIYFCSVRMSVNV